MLLKSFYKRRVTGSPIYFLRKNGQGKFKKQTVRQTHRRIVKNHLPRRFEGCTSQIRSYLEVDFLHDSNTSIDMEVIQ